MPQNKPQYIKPLQLIQVTELCLVTHCSCSCIFYRQLLPHLSIVLQTSVFFILVYWMP